MIDPPVTFELSQADKHSELWARLNVHLQQRIETLHQTNERDTNERETAALRGRISELRALMALGKDRT